MRKSQSQSHSLYLKNLTPVLAIASVIGLGSATSHAASLDLDFQATIASEQHPDYAGEARYFHVSTNSANPGTGSFAATIVGTNNPAAPFVRNYDGPVVAFKFAGGTNSDITSVAASGGAAGTITFTTTDGDGYDGFGQQQAKVWTTTDPGYDIQVAGADPYGASGDDNSTGGYRSLSDATGTIDISALTAGSVHIYYGAFSATPSVSVVMRDTDLIQPDITIADAHSIADGGNGDAAQRTEYYLAEIDFVNDLGYDEIEFVWDAGSGNGRGIGVVVTDAPAPDAVDPTLAPVDIVDSVSGGPIVSDGTSLSYTVTYSEFMDPATISTDDFEILGTGSAGGTIESVAHYGGVSTVTVLPDVGTSGTIQLQVKALEELKDLAGNALDTSSAIADDTTITVTADTTAPTVVSFESPSVSGTIYGTPTITYTVTFSEYVNALTSGNFTNAGDAPFAIGTVTDISPGFPSPSVYTVEVIPSGSGTVQLEVQGTVEDLSSNALIVPVTDTTVYTLDTGTEPARETVTLDASTTSDLTDPIHELVFDASASDKLVVIVTGENGNPGSLAGKVNSITYDGVALTQAVGRLPIDSPPSAYVDQLYNDIWYLDDPAAATALLDSNDSNTGTAGNISADVDSRGVITAIRLSGTATGVGATEISDQQVKSASLLASTSGGMVLASLGMGGDANTADTENVNTDPAPAELSAVKQGGNWDGHVTFQTLVVSPGFVTATFTGGNTIGTHTIAAEFPGALVSAGSAYDTWAGGFGGLSDPTADLDFDKGGLETGIEWVVDGDPTDGSDDASVTPVLDNTTDPDFLIFTYRRSDAALADGNTAIEVEYGTDLSGWTTAVAGADILINATDDGAAVGVDLVEVKLRRSTFAVGGKLFARLNVVVTP